MLKIIKNSENFKTELDWLRSYHHFSFGEHFHPDKITFGPLRVFNDDVIQSGKGFNFHQHNDMEIVTYVIDGILEHKDDFGNNGIIELGEVQRMSAGTGILHSEYNHSTTDSLKLLQIWIHPNQKGLKPSWEQRKFSINQRLNNLLCIVSPESDDSSLSIHQDVSFFVSRLENFKVQHNFAKNRMGYLFVISGKVQINDVQLNTKDSVEIQSEDTIVLETLETCEIILLDLPENYTFNK